MDRATSWARAAGMVCPAVTMSNDASARGARPEETDLVVAAH